MARKLGELVLDIETKLAKLKAELKKAEGATKASAAKQKKFVGGIKKAWIGIAAGVAIAVIGIKKALKVAVEFEQAIANVVSVSGDAKKALAALAREAGKKTVFSATEAADAMYFLASAGLKVKDMAKVLEPTLNLAAAAQIGIAEATDLVVNNLKVFGASMDDAEMFTDIMAQTVRSANTDMNQLGEALGYIGPVAKAAGVSFEEINVLIAALANRGIKGAKAGVQLRMAFTRLIKPTKGAKDALAKYGITTQEINRLLPTPIKLFQKLHDVNLSQADALEILGVRQTGIFSLIKDGTGDIKNLTKAISENEGAAADMAETQISTVAGAFKLLTSKIQEFILVLTSDALPGLRKFITGVGGAVEAISEMVETTGKFGTNLSDFDKQLLSTGEHYKFTTKGVQDLLNKMHQASKEVDNSRKRIDELVAANKKLGFLNKDRVENYRKISYHENLIKKRQKGITKGIETLGIESELTADKFRQAYETIRQEYKTTQETAEETGEIVKDNPPVPKPEVIEESKLAMTDYYEFLDMKREEELLKLEENYTKVREFAEQNGLDLAAIDAQYEAQKSIIENRVVASSKKNAGIVAKAWESASKKVASDWSGSMADSIVAGEAFKKSFTGFLKDLIKEFAKLIIKALIYKGIMAALGGIGGLLGLSGGGKIPGLSKGSKIKYGQTGFKAKGTDTVPAMLTPRERVLSVKDNELLEDFINRFSEIMNVPTLASSGAGDITTTTTTDQSKQVIIQGDLIMQPQAESENDVMEDLHGVDEKTGSQTVTR